MPRNLFDDESVQCIADVVARDKRRPTDNSSVGPIAPRISPRDGQWLILKEEIVDNCTMAKACKLICAHPESPDNGYQICLDEGDEEEFTITVNGIEIGTDFTSGMETKDLKAAIAAADDPDEILKGIDCAVVACSAFFYPADSVEVSTKSHESVCVPWFPLVGGHYEVIARTSCLKKEGVSFRGLEKGAVVLGTPIFRCGYDVQPKRSLNSDDWCDPCNCPCDGAALTYGITVSRINCCPEAVGEFVLTIVSDGLWQSDPLDCDGFATEWTWNGSQLILRTPDGFVVYGPNPNGPPYDVGCGSRLNLLSQPDECNAAPCVCIGPIECDDGELGPPVDFDCDRCELPQEIEVCIEGNYANPPVSPTVQVQIRWRISRQCITLKPNQSLVMVPGDGDQDSVVHYEGMADIEWVWQVVPTFGNPGSEMAMTVPMYFFIRNSCLGFTRIAAFWGNPNYQGSSMYNSFNTDSATDFFSTGTGGPWLIADSPNVQGQPCNFCRRPQSIDIPFYTIDPTINATQTGSQLLPPLGGSGYTGPPLFPPAPGVEVRGPQNIFFTTSSYPDC